MDYRNGIICLVYIANQVIPATQEASTPFYIDRKNDMSRMMWSIMVGTLKQFGGWSELNLSNTFQKMKPLKIRFGVLLRKSQRTKIKKLDLSRRKYYLELNEPDNSDIEGRMMQLTLQHTMRRTESGGEWIRHTIKRKGNMYERMRKAEQRA